MMVLFVILREARVRKTAEIEFASQANLLEALGVGINKYNRRRLRDSLELWRISPSAIVNGTKPDGQPMSAREEVEGRSVTKGMEAAATSH